MTVAQQHRQTLSLAQWRALGEDTSVRSELVRGVVTVAPMPRPMHSLASSLLWRQIFDQAPLGALCLQEVEVLLASGSRPTVRVPDISLFERPAAQPMPAARVHLVVEILSPGNRSTDVVTKRAEYQRAGIGAYWIIDLDDGPSAELLTLVDGEYRAETVRGGFTVDVPVPLTIDLAALIDRD